MAEEYLLFCAGFLAVLENQQVEFRQILRFDEKFVVGWMAGVISLLIENNFAIAGQPQVP